MPDRSLIIAVSFQGKLTPGQQAQFTFAAVGLPWGRQYALLVVLGYSRLLHLEFVPRPTALLVMHGVERAFAKCGVPTEILFDQEEKDILQRIIHGAESLEDADRKAIDDLLGSL